MAKEKIVFTLVFDDQGNVSKLKSVEKGFKDIDLTVKNAQKSAELLNSTVRNLGSAGNIKSIKLTRKEYEKLSKTQAQLKNATGAGTSAALELGRVISDMPYGIRGVANNLSQFASNITFMATATDKATGRMVGLSGAIKGLWRALMGPLGILLAIQAVIAALDSLSGQQKKTGDTTEDLTKKFKQQDLILRELSRQYLEYSGNQQLNDFITKALIQKESKLSKTLNDSTKSQEEKNKVVEEYLRLKNLEVENENRLKRIKDIRNKQEEKESSIREKFKPQLAEFQSFPKAIARLTDKMNSEISKSLQDGNVEINKELNTYVATLSEIQKITDKLFASENNKKAGKTKTSKIEFLESPEEFESKALDLERKMLSLQQKLSLIDAKDKNERLARENDFQVKSLRLVVDAEKKKAKVRLENYIEDINRQVKSEKIDEFDAKESIDRAKITSEKEVQAIEEAYEPLFGFLEKIFLARKKAIGGDEQGLIDIETSIGYFKNLYSGLNDFLAAEAEREMTMERNKTNSLNTELNNRLLNENLSKDERKRIQNEIWKNDEKLRVKQDEVKKKQFKSQKAFNISMALADTYLSATKAYASQLIPGDPTSIVRAKIAAAVATTTGLLNVAMIARQKFQPSASNTPISVGSAGGGGGGVGDRDFNFNIVGGDRENQLVGAIQEQFDKPLKAFVVSKDVTTQQQLDANTRTSASF